MIERNSQPRRDDRESRRIDAERSPGHLDGALEPQLGDCDPRPRAARAEYAFVEVRVVRGDEIDAIAHLGDEVPHARELGRAGDVPPRDAVQVGEFQAPRPRPNEPVLAARDVPLFDAAETDRARAVRVADGRAPREGWPRGHRVQPNGLEGGGLVPRVRRRPARYSGG